MDLIIIISLLLVAAVVVALVGMYLLFGTFLPSVFTVWSASRDDDLVDTEAEILPLQERHSSEVLKDRGNGVKTFIPLPITQQLSHPPQASPEVVRPAPVQAIAMQPQSPQVAPAMTVQPEPMQPPPTPTTNVPVAPAVAEAPQELVQRAPILDVQNPIVQPPPPQPIDVQIPDSEVYNQAENKSSFGVRYSSNSSGRVLRDKRRNRNAE